MEKDALSVIVTHVMKNIKNMDGIQKPAWEEVYNWVVLDQACVYKALNPVVVGLEMTGIWCSWYYDVNLRTFIKNLHSEFKNEDITSQSTTIKIFNKLWDKLNSVFIEYDDELGEIGDDLNLTAVDCANMFKMAENTFKFNPNYPFGQIQIQRSSQLRPVNGNVQMVVSDINLK